MISDTKPPPLDDDGGSEKKKFTWPPLLAYGNMSKGAEIKPYTYQSMNQNSENYNIELSHMFLENCYLLTKLQPWLALLSVYGLVLGTLWICALYKIQRGRQYLLQPWLSIIPITRAIWWL